MKHILPLLLPYAIFMYYVATDAPRRLRAELLSKTTAVFMVLAGGKVSGEPTFETISTIACLAQLWQMSKKIQETGDG